MSESYSAEHGESYDYIGPESYDPLYISTNIKVTQFLRILDSAEGGCGKRLP